MPRFHPFAGVRYNLERVTLDEVAAPPYDVIDDADRANLLRQHAANAVRIDLPQNEEGEDRYHVAPDLIASWLRDGLLIVDPEPTFYGYSMTFIDGGNQPRTTIGVLGSLQLEAPETGGIRPHEHTTPKAKSDRLTMLQVCRMNLSPIWGLSPASGLTDRIATTGDLLGEHTDSDGTQHRLWRIVDPSAIEAISAMVDAHPVVIADGHHRFETSLAYREERRQIDGEGGPADSALFFVMELSEDTLAVRPIHRLLHGASLDAIESTLAEHFLFGEGGSTADLTEAIVESLVHQGVLGLVGPERWHSLTPRDAVFDQVRDLDSCRLEHALSSLPEIELTYQHDAARIGARVQRGDAPVGVLLRPVTVASIIEIANGGERMPPKSTFFYPKLRTGLVFRRLD